VDRTYDAKTIMLQGSLTSSTTAKSVVGIALKYSGPRAFAATKASSASASSGGTTSFGSTIDFTLVYGLNGGPTWSFKKFKGPTGSGSLLTASRTTLDTLSITFVAACQNWQGGAPTAVGSYWDSIPSCDEVGTPQQSAAFAYQANSLMILKSLLQRPGASLP
jgi:hypothetical protein